MPRPRNVYPTPAELEVLKVLWRIGPATVRDVMAELDEHRPRAYTSVMSLMNVMAEKRLLKRERNGRAYVYHPLWSEEATLGGLVSDLCKRAFEGSTKALVAHLLEQTSPSAEELDEIRRFIEAYRRQQGDDS